MKRHLASIAVAFLVLPQVASAALTTNLVSYYKFDASNSNDSVASNNGTDSSVTYGSSYGKISNGFWVNGGVVDVNGIASLFSSTNPWSISVWFYAPSLATGHHVFSTNVSAASSYTCYGLNWVVNGDGSVFAYHGNCSGTETLINTNTGIVTAGAWYHLVATFDGGSTYHMYVNAVDRQTASGRGLTTGTMGVASFGASRYGSTLETSNAYFDEYAVYSRALSGAEVTSLYNAGAGFQWPFVLWRYQIWGLMAF